MKYADLHLHTNFSDGTFSPEQLILRAKKAGLSCISVVDHDTVSGIALSIEAGLKEDIEVIPGIELTADYEGTEIHFLGYFIDHKNKKLIDQLAILKENRIQRIYKMAEKLNALGIGLSAESVFEISGFGSVGRLHVARAMVKQGLVATTNEAFNRFIGDKGPAYISGFKLTPKEAIALIKQAGGVPVLAHPYSLRNDELIKEFAKLGLIGLEVHYSEHSQAMVNFYLDLAKEYNLLVTGGSDCHGNAKPEVKIGSIKIPYELVEKLKEAVKKNA